MVITSLDQIVEEDRLAQFERLHSIGLVEEYLADSENDLEAFAMRGEFSLRELAKIYGGSHERMRQQLIREGLLEVRNRARDYYKQRLIEVKGLKHSFQEQFAEGILNLAFSKAGNPQRLALITRRNYKVLGPSFQVLEKFWERYFDGTNKSIRELISGLSMSSNLGHLILQKGELPPHHKYSERKHYNLGRIAAALTAASDLSIADRAHYSGIPNHVLKYHKATIGFHRMSGEFELHHNLSYRSAMQYLEAKDAGFNDAEAVELSGIRPEYGPFCLNNRQQLEAEVAHFMEHLENAALITSNVIVYSL